MDILDLRPTAVLKLDANDWLACGRIDAQIRVVNVANAFLKHSPFCIYVIQHYIQTKNRPTPYFVNACLLSLAFTALAPQSLHKPVDEWTPLPHLAQG